MPAPRASILPSPHTNARNAGVNSPSPFMEGGGRQAGGEVIFPLANFSHLP